MSAARHRRAWSDEDLRILAWCWGQQSLASLAERLGRKPAAVYRMAVNRGLSARAGDEVSIEVASRRMGYSPRKLREILAAAGVQVRRKPRGLVHDPKPVGRRYLVDIDECRRAVIEWQERVPVEEAARLLGEYGATLRRWLARAGVLRRERPHQVVRVTVDECRAVVAQMRGV